MLKFLKRLLSRKGAKDGTDGWSYATPGSYAKGGKGGHGGRGRGGDGGHAVVIGKGSVAIGGKGGDAA